MYGSETEKESAKTQNLVAIIELHVNFWKRGFRVKAPKRWRLRMWTRKLRFHEKLTYEDAKTRFSCECPQKLKDEDVKTKFSCKTSLKYEDAKTRFSCECSLKWKLNMWKEFAEKLTAKLKHAKIKRSVKNPCEDAVVSAGWFCAARGLARITCSFCS